MEMFAPLCLFGFSGEKLNFGIDFFMNIMKYQNSMLVCRARLFDSEHRETSDSSSVHVFRGCKVFFFFFFFMKRMQSWKRCWIGSHVSYNVLLFYDRGGARRMQKYGYFLNPFYWMSLIVTALSQSLTTTVVSEPRQMFGNHQLPIYMSLLEIIIQCLLRVLLNYYYYYYQYFEHMFILQFYFEEASWN